MRRGLWTTLSLGVGALAVACGASNAPGSNAAELDAGDGTAFVPGPDGAPEEKGPPPPPLPDGDVVDADGSACSTFTPNSVLASMRAACAFASGAKVLATVDDALPARAAITHIIILTHENRSLDHMYGTTGAGIEGFPSTYTNPNPSGGTAAPTHLTTSCPADIPHSPAAISEEWDQGKMDGFYKADGPEALGYYDPSDHPFYSWLVTTFATSDRYFCSTLGDTGLNRRFLYGASATATANNIFTEMDAASVTWGDYFTGTEPIYNTYQFPANSPHLHPYSDFLPALDAGTLPSVTYLDSPSDEHPPGSVHDGEGVVYQVLQHAFASPLWSHLAIIFNYDEGGGFFDHVAPPTACLPSTAAADATYNHEGFRVPLIVISPFARKGYVSHIDHSHTSVVRLVELLHDLPAITARDANSDALLDMFDFACPDFDSPPMIGPKPPQGC
jgi:phospholipase C